MPRRDHHPEIRLEFQTPTAVANLTNSQAWFPRCRLAWMERQAQQAGSINRSDLSATFGISKAQASADFQEYLTLNPGSLIYDLRSKAYHWNPSSPLIIHPAPWANFPA
jgi:hypothetical protein